jgi:hypothetical protein
LSGSIVAVSPAGLGGAASLPQREEYERTRPDREQQDQGEEEDDTRPVQLLHVRSVHPQNHPVVNAAVALLGGLGLNLASHRHGGGPVARGVFGVYLGLLMAHFVIDAGMWRMRDAFPRAFLSARAPPKSRQWTRPKGKSGTQPGIGWPEQPPLGSFGATRPAGLHPVGSRRPKRV